MPSKYSHLSSGQGGKEKNAKKRKVVSWDRDIICLPKTTRKGELATVLPYPRKKFRSNLGAWGLIGKIHLNSEMSVDDVENEIRSVFRIPMNNDKKFPFTYLQPTGEGNYSLTVPSVSASYQWTAQQVAKLANSRGCVYIMALDDLDIQDIEDSDVSTINNIILIVDVDKIFLFLGKL